MIIGIDANALTRTQYTGTERYLHALLLHMMREPLCENERVILYSSAPVSSIEPLPEGWNWKLVDWPLSKGWTHGGLSLELLRRPPDMFFTPVHEVPLFHRRTKIVNTVHDIAFAVEPKTYSFLSRIRQRWAIGKAIRQSDRLLTVSETTKQDLHRLYGVPLEKMIVTSLAIESEDFVNNCSDRNKSLLSSFSLNERSYFLTVGRVEEKKNIGVLLEAFFAFKKRRGPADATKLVLAGGAGEGSERFKRMVAQSPFGGDVHFFGFVSDEKKRDLLSCALAYVFPSRYEGFGIPALEAMASDCPLLASDIPALREVAGDAALFAPVDDVQAWADNMNLIVSDAVLRHDLVNRGRDRVRIFSWEATAHKTWEVLRTVYGRHQA